jgi:hypothetical protein
MNKKKVIIILASLLVFVGLLTVFVFKARGSIEREMVSGCVPYNVEISKEGEYEAAVKWNTTEECLGYVSYGNDRNKLDFIAVNNDDLSSKQHRVVIDKLLPSQNYFFVINSGNKSYGSKGVPLSFSLSSL